MPNSPAHKNEQATPSTNIKHKPRTPPPHFNRRLAPNICSSIIKSLENSMLGKLPYSSSQIIYSTRPRNKTSALTFTSQVEPPTIHDMAQELHQCFNYMLVHASLMPHTSRINWEIGCSRVVGTTTQIPSFLN